MNSSNDKYLCISKSTHRPRNKKPHECGAYLRASFYSSVLVEGNWNKSSTEQLRVFAIFNERTVDGT